MSWPVVGARYADLFRGVAAGEEGARPMAARATYSAVAAGVPRLESLNGAAGPAEEPAAGLVGSVRNG
jgi:hypothetical protein